MKIKNSGNSRQYLLDKSEMGNAEVQEITLSYTESGLLVRANCFEGTQSIRPLANGNAANGWTIRAG